MQERLVSILTPCYNTAHLVWRLLDSVLNQTYPYIEMFIIDDGSSDNTRELYERYSEKFHAKGYVLNYIYQENQGQSAAINNGLKLINGEFLVWPDSDDFYATDNAIEKMVFALASASYEYAMVRTLERVLDESTLEELCVSGLDAEAYEGKDLFEDCLFARNGFYFVPGAYMVRVEALKYLTDMEIYTHKDAGQNWQIFLPVLYSYKCITIKEILYNVLAREDSHSRGGYRGYNNELKRIRIYEDTILNTLDRLHTMSAPERDSYKMLIKIKYLELRLNIAYSYRKRFDFAKDYRDLTEVLNSKITSNLRIKKIAVTAHMESVLDFLINLKNKIIA